MNEFEGAEDWVFVGVLIFKKKKKELDLKVENAQNLEKWNI